jgi:hypothetical protein
LLAALVVMLIAIARDALPHRPRDWVSISGHPVPLGAARLVCDGEVAKVQAASSTDNQFGSIINRYAETQAVRKGCMASQGWKLDGPGEAR